MKSRIWIVLCLLGFGLAACGPSEQEIRVTQTAVIATSNAKKTAWAAEEASRPTSTRSASSSSSSSCTEYSGEYDVVFIAGTANVYGGVDSPSSSIKGTITGGAAGIEAKCGSYYRLKGVDWWGWVKISDTYR